MLATYGPVCCFGDACRFPDPVIDLRLQFPDPGSYTVHHLDPLALGGSLLDLDRARPAHLRCNSSHGARPMAPPDRMSCDW